MYTLSEFDVLNIIDRAIEFGVKTRGQQDALAIQFAAYWLEGYIYGNEVRLSEADIKSLRETIKNYYFT